MSQKMESVTKDGLAKDPSSI